MISLNDLPVPTEGENFFSLLQNDSVTVEAIISSDRLEPKLYDQDHDETVLLYAGEAVLQIEDREVTMKPGDILHIPAHTPHRVLRTKPATRWLAIRSREPLKEVNIC